jgi:hypothetical protein
VWLFGDRDVKRFQVTESCNHQIRSACTESACSLPCAQQPPNPFLTHNLTVNINIILHLHINTTNVLSRHVFRPKYFITIHHLRATRHVNPALHHFSSIPFHEGCTSLSHHSDSHKIRSTCSHRAYRTRDSKSVLSSCRTENTPRLYYKVELVNAVC